MAIELPDRLDEWADVLQQALLRAGKDWSELALNSVMPNSLQAAAEPVEQGTQISLEALLSTSNAWAAAATTEMSPALIAFMVAQAWDVATARKIDLRELSTPATTPTEHKAAFAEAKTILHGWGFTDEQIDVVVATRGWWDEMAAQLAVTPNKVVGMPETIYRDLVKKLGVATQEGASQFDRNLIVREFLDMNREGGFEKWNTRAARIARTETHRLINAGTMQAARAEQQISGETLRKAWVCTWDSRTRDDHFRADGQVVPLAGKFLIGGYEADYPGDPNLPAHLSINCRCTHIILGEDEELPDNTDRQTERERRSAAEAGTTRVPQAEVTRRAARGVTRDADNQQLTAATLAKENDMTRQAWSGVLAPVGKPSGDGRILMEDAQITFRDFPLPLMFQKTQSEGHNTGVIVGKIEAGTIEGGAVHATGVLFDTPEATEAAELLAEEVIRPSVDLCDMVVDWVVMDADGNHVEDLDELEDLDGLSEQMQVSEATIMGATLVAKPAFAEAKISLGEQVENADDGAEHALVAAAAVAVRHDAALFANPQLAGPTPLTVDGDHVYGHLALWGTEHMSFPGKGVQPPRSATNYALFHTSQLETDKGAMSVGRLTVGTGHATARDDVHAAAEHYDSTGTTWAFVKAGEDKYGIWVAGVVNPDADAAQVRAGAAAPLSGDWRRVGNNLELVAALSVNTPGFPVPRAFQNAGTESLSLVAAGVAPRLSKYDQMVAAVREAMRADREEEAAAKLQAERTRATRAMAAQIMATSISRGV